MTTDPSDSLTLQEKSARHGCQPISHPTSEAEKQNRVECTEHCVPGRCRESLQNVFGCGPRCAAPLPQAIACSDGSRPISASPLSLTPPGGNNGHCAGGADYEAATHTNPQRGYEKLFRLFRHVPALSKEWIVGNRADNISETFETMLRNGAADRRGRTCSPPRRHVGRSPATASVNALASCIGTRNMKFRPIGYPQCRREPAKT